MLCIATSRIAFSLKILPWEAFSSKMLARGSIFIENASPRVAFSVKILPLGSIFIENAPPREAFSIKMIPWVACLLKMLPLGGHFH